MAAMVVLGSVGVGILAFRAISWLRRGRRLSEGRWGETLAAFERATRSDLRPTRPRPDAKGGAPDRRAPLHGTNRRS